MTVLEQAADYVAGAKHTELSRQTQEDLFVHYLDTIGAYLCGANTSEGRALMNLYRPRGPSQPRLHGDSMFDHAMIVSAVTRSSEIDDIHLSSCTTPGSVIISAALAVMASEGTGRIDTDTFKDSILVGYEMMTRLGLCIRGPEVIYKGIWPTYFCAAFGAAATVSRLLNLSKEQIVHALCLALSFSTGGSAKINGNQSIRWITLGHAVRSGCMAAFVAQNGFIGDSGMLDGDWLSRTYGMESDVNQLVGNLGQGSLIRSISLKPYCSAKQVIASIHGMETMLADGIKPDEIKSVDVFVPRSYLSMIDHGINPAERLSTLTSAPYQLALAVMAPEKLFDVNRVPVPMSKEIGSFMEKVRVHEDRDLSIHYPNRWPARIRLETNDGGSREMEIVDTPGDPGARFGIQDEEMKFHRFLDPILGYGKTQSMIESASEAYQDKFRLEDFAKRIIDSSQEEQK